jgi:protein TonB
VFVPTPPLKVRLIPVPESPPPERPPEPRPPQRQDRMTVAPVPVPMPDDSLTARPTPFPTPPDTRPPGPIEVVRVETPLPPIRREAVLIAGNLQPPYPAAEQRAQRNGSVRIRLTIGADGRVAAVERLHATSDAFWRVTERQALGRWRFRPATVDGRPTTGTKVLTVTFRIEDI